MHHSMQTPPPMQQQSHFVVDHRARPEDAAVHITVSVIAMKYNFMFSVTVFELRTSTYKHNIQNYDDRNLDTVTLTVTPTVNMSYAHVFPNFFRFQIRYNMPMV